MTAAADLVSFSRADLEELYRYWSGESAPAARDEEACRDAVRRLMGERARVMARFQELPIGARTLLRNALQEKGHRVPLRRPQDNKNPADGVRALMADPSLGYLKKRGFVIEERDRSWP